MTRLGVISKNTYGEYRVRDIQINGSWKVNPYPKTHVIIPEHLIDDISKTNGFCDIELNDDETELVSYKERLKPVIKHPIEFSLERVVTKFLLQHEYQFCLMEHNVRIPEDRSEIRLFNLCKACIAYGNIDEVKAKIDHFLMYNKITLDEYNTLVSLINK